jgi:hypothetical protein
MSVRDIVQAGAGAGGAAGAAGEENLYIEDVFSTYLYTGTGAAQTITNDIDLNGEGGLVWIRSRSAATGNFLFDTERGALDELNSNTTDAEASLANSLTAFNSDGFSISSATGIGVSAATYASWTFRKAPKFFDVVTYTGTGSARTVSHNLGSVPGCIMVKRTDTTGNWQVYHRANTANPETDYLVLNTTAATADSNTRWNDTAPTDSVFTVGTEATVNASGGTYVAYLFAHDAGGFGDDGEQNVISCGSFTTDGSYNSSTTLGWEPQLVIAKRSDSTSGWFMWDMMRGMPVDGDSNWLYANTSGAEPSSSVAARPNATGFTTFNLAASATFIYIAIRRGPMKTPTSGTQVFSPTVYTGTNADNRLVNTSLLTDMVMIKERNDTGPLSVADRLRGNPYLVTSSTAAEVADADSYMTPTSGVGNAFSAMNGVGVGNDATSKVNIDTTSNNHISFAFKRAPGFFDVVCYTGTGVGDRQVTHNLGVTPELLIVKIRSITGAWRVLSTALEERADLHLTGAFLDTFMGLVFGTGGLAGTYVPPTSTTFTVGTDSATNSSGNTYVAYLFASLAGISDIGTYTGNGSSVTVTTGFQPRFILVKRTDSTGNWIVGDSARGLVAGDDPYLLFNSNAAEDTDEDWVDVSATGFTVNETTANANVNTGTYIYLAIA